MRNSLRFSCGLLAVTVAAFAAPQPDSAPAAVEPTRTVRGIHLRTDRSLDFFSRETLLAGTMRPEMTDEEKAIAIWRLTNRRIWHFPRPDENDPMRVLNVYGYALCGTIQRVMVWLAQGVWGQEGGGSAGLNSRPISDPRMYEIAAGGWLVDSMMRLGGRKPSSTGQVSTRMGHTWCQLYYGGRAAFLDAHAGFFVYTADGKHIASISEIAGDFTLVSDPVRTSEPFMPCDGGRPEFFYRCTGGARDKGLQQTRHSMALTVRPGETLTFHFDKLPGAYFKRSRSWLKQWVPEFYADGPFHRCPGAGDGHWRHYGNGEIRFRPDLTKNGFRESLAEFDNLAAPADSGNPGLRPARAGQPLRLAFGFETPYVMVGGEVEAEFELPPGTTASLSLVSPVRGVRPQLLARAEGAEGKDRRQRLRGVMDLFEARYPYDARILIETTGGTDEAPPALLDLDIRFVTQLNFLTLPRLLPGPNTVHWSNAPETAPEGTGLTLTWTWTETGGKERTDRRTITASDTTYPLAVGTVDTQPEENPKYMRHIELHMPD